jgi:hypothetical protein
MRTLPLTLAVAAAVAAGAPALGAQSDLPLRRPEIRLQAGAYVPEGAMRADFATARLAGVQGAIELYPGLHATGTFNRVRARTTFGYAADRATFYQYDVGFEANARRSLGGAWLLRPFVGAGGGGRTYDYAERGVLSQTCTAGYATLGSEVQRGAAALRAEAREYLVCYTAPRSGRNVTRNDVTMTLGVAYHLP